MADSRIETTIRELYCMESSPDPCGMVIFGASGDLTSRKLIPSLFNLYHHGLLPEQFLLLGCARSSMTDDAFRNKQRQALSGTPAGSGEKVEQFLRRCHYLRGDYKNRDLYESLTQRLGQLEKTFGGGDNRLFYLATPAGLYTSIVEGLGRSGLAQEPHAAGPWRRVIVEKPFGEDLESARTLNGELHHFVNERQIYRIDHYLGKDTVQNIFIFRFANTLFEPILNRRYIDHVQITVAESLGVEHRAGYFDNAGLLRDMFQNHMLQMLALVAMEPPVRFEANRIQDEKVKVLRAIKPFPPEQLSRWLVRGQYHSGCIDGRKVPGYRQEPGVSDNSLTETYVAARLFVDTWRWQSVPFYLRAEKRLARKESVISIEFKPVPHSIFLPLTEEDLSPNVLTLNVLPEEGMSLTIQAKRPGPKLCMGDLTMAFKYRDVFGTEPPDAYERLLLDAMVGDQTLFIRYDCMEAAWELITPVLDLWSDGSGSPEVGLLHDYKAATWGPSQADALLAQDGRRWREM